MVSTNLCNPNRPGPSGGANQRFRIGVPSDLGVLAIRSESRESSASHGGVKRNAKEIFGTLYFRHFFCTLYRRRREALSGAPSEVQQNEPVSHYDSTRWIDYVRGLVSAPEQHEMSAHLLECSSCREEHDLLTKLAVRMQADLQYQVPEYALRNVRALFAANAKANKTVLQKLVGHLVFDSLQQPAMAGARSNAHGMRHALYEAGDYSVDLRLEEHPGSTRVNMVGQLAVRSQTVNSLDGIPVVLMSGREILAKAVSNKFGEFQLDYEPKRQLKLHVPIQQRRERIELQLGSLVPKARKKSSSRK